MISLVVIAITGSLSALSHYNLLKQFDQQRALVHANHRRSVHGLIDQSLKDLEKTAWMIPTMAGMGAALRPDDPTSLAESFDDLWLSLQINMGLDLAGFYDDSGRVLGMWGRSGLRVEPPDTLTRWVEEAIRRERPITVLDSTHDCIQYAVVPLLVDGGGAGAVVLGSSVADVVLDFKRISGADVGLLIIDSDDASRTGERAIPKWKARVIALTDVTRNLRLLQEASRRHPDIEDLKTSVHHAFGGRYYELLPIPLREFGIGNRAYLVTIEDISAPLSEIKTATRSNLHIGLFGLLSSELLLLALLSTPVARLRRTAQNLPMLAEGAFETVRKAIRGRAGTRLPQDEIDALDETAIAVSYQLENLEQQVAERNSALRNQMEALAQERDFVTSLLDTAQVVILTQDDDGIIRMVNAYGQSLTGYDEYEIRAIPFHKLLMKDDYLANLPERLTALCVGQQDLLQHEAKLVCKDGSTRDVAWLHSRLTNPSAQNPVILSVGLDVTQRKHAESRLAWLASHDPLTGLLNRRRIQEELEKTLATARRYGRPGALLVMDLDQFKYVNDTSGHPSGDMLLNVVAQALSRIVRSVDAIGRLGGDEFAILLRETDEEGAVETAKKINARLREIELPVNGSRHRVSASVGIVRFPVHGTNAHDLLAAADLAMYQAKEAGGGRWYLYTEADQTKERMQENVFWKNRVEQALAEDDFVLYYQPIVEVGTGRVTHYEALLRMREKDGSVVPPGAFIRVCERTGLIHAIDRMVLVKAIAQLGALARAGEDVKVSINLSAYAFENPELLPALRETLQRCGVDPKCLIFEITETATVADFSAARKLMESVRALGCSFALDDFGVGFSSFYYLKQLPVDYVKIDGSFIRNLCESPDDQILVRAMHEVAKGFGKKTVAEFVENEEIFHVLREFQIDFAQGYHIGKPQPADEVFGCVPKEPDFRSADSHGVPNV